MLSCFGSLFSPFSYFILVSVPLAALGIGTLILGLSILLTPSAPIPKKTVTALIEGSIANLELILEEFNLTEKGYYTANPNGGVYAYIPLSKDAGKPRFPTPPRGMITNIDGKPYLTLIPPASELVKVEEGSSLEASISEALVDLTELCESVSVFEEDEVILVEARGVRGHIGAGRFRQILGSLEACIAATIAAKVTGFPVYVESEEDSGKRRRIRLRVCRS